MTLPARDCAALALDSICFGCLMTGILVGNNSMLPGISRTMKPSSIPEPGPRCLLLGAGALSNSGEFSVSLLTMICITSSSSPNKSSKEPLIKPESVLGICGNTGLDPHGGLDRIGVPGLVLITGGEDPMSGGVPAGLMFLSGDGLADSMEYLI